MDTIRSIFSDVCHGGKDAIFGMFKVYKFSSATPERTKKLPERKTVLAQRRAAERKPQREIQEKSRPPVVKMVLQCCAWNGGIFWLSIVIFNSLLLPYLRIITQLIFGDLGAHSVVWQWVGPILSYLFGALWVLPLFVLSRIVNSFWFQDIADMTYRQSRGRPMLPGISQFIADFVFSTLLQALFLIQGMVTRFVPVVGPAVGFIHISLLYSLYAFEYKWLNMGWGVHKRVQYVEANWAYFCGFGLPLAACTSVPASYVVSGCVFGILFPLFIVSANEADRLTRQAEFPVSFFNMAVGATNIIFHQTVEKWVTRRPQASAGSQSQHSSPRRSESNTSR